MRADKEVLGLLMKKKEYFLIYEQETDKMNTNSTKDVDRITAAVERRQELMGQIDRIDEEIAIICGKEEEGALLLQAARNQCDYKSLPAELTPVYQAGQQIYQIIARIQDEEVLVESNLRSILEQLQNLIKQNKQERKFSGYLKNMDYSGDVKKGFLYNEKR